MEKNGVTGINSKFARGKIVERMRSDKTLLYTLTKDPRLIGISIEDLHTNPNVSVYFGETGQKLREEDLRWLTARGDLAGGANRPTLEWSEPRGKKAQRTNIWASEARKELGFKSCVLHEDVLKVNTTAIEDMLQSKCHALGLPRRLHRRVGAGSSGFKRYFEDEEDEDEENRPSKVHKVFMAYSFDAVPAIAKGDVIVRE